MAANSTKTVPLVFVLAALSSLGPAVIGCSGSQIRGDAEEDGPADPVAHEISDAPFEWPEVTDAYSPDLMRTEPEAMCGDGSLDPGEECDDGNRLDGDGCDWLCRLGDGDPTPDPDPSVPDYEPDGDPVLVVADGSIGEHGGSPPISIAWTGSEYAVAFPDGDPDAGLPHHVRFLRTDRLGSLIDVGWFYELPAPSRGVDVTWTGDFFGLFFDLDDTGIFLLRLDIIGKPLGNPVLVEADPTAHYPAADVGPSGFVLAWLKSEPYYYSCVWQRYCVRATSEVTCSTRVRLVGFDGSTVSLPGPVIIEEPSAGPPDVAMGPAGIGITTGLKRVPEEPYTCAFRFLWTDTDLTSFRYSGMLSDGRGGDVVWATDHFATAWSSHERSPYIDTCMARFDGAGDLEKPPVCTQTWAESVLSGGTTGHTLLAAGDGGMGLVFFPGSDIDSAHPWFIRTDMDGVPVSPMQWSIATRAWGGTAAIAWGDSAFGVVFRSKPNLWFQRFVARD